MIHCKMSSGNDVSPSVIVFDPNILSRKGGASSEQKVEQLRGSVKSVTRYNSQGRSAATSSQKQISGPHFGLHVGLSLPPINSGQQATRVHPNAAHAGPAMHCSPMHQSSMGSHGGMGYLGAARNSTFKGQQKPPQQGHLSQALSMQHGSNTRQQQQDQQAALLLPMRGSFDAPMAQLALQQHQMLAAPTVPVMPLPSSFLARQNSNASKRNHFGLTMVSHLRCTLGICSPRKHYRINRFNRFRY